MEEVEALEMAGRSGKAMKTGLKMGAHECLKNTWKSLQVLRFDPQGVKEIDLILFGNSCRM